jgi:hypothetical protein
VHPGIVHGTNLGPWLAEGEERTPWLNGAQLQAMGLIDEWGAPIRNPDRELKTPEQGASTIVFAATSPLLAEIGGVYLKDNDISPLDENAKPFAFGSAESPSSDVVPYAVDSESAQRLWQLSAQLVKV